LLKNVAICTDIFQGDGVTISKVLPSIRSLLINTKKLNLKHLDHIQTSVLEIINNRFNFVEKDGIYGLAAMLDPSFGISWTKDKYLPVGT
jgi:hypothetical protein